MNTKKRGLLASAGALLTSAALLLGGAAATQAAPVSTMPATSKVVITKLKQSEQATVQAPGTPQNIGDAVRIEGVTFEARRVQLENDPRSNAGQHEIAGLTLAQAKDKLIAAPAAPAASGTTNAQGVVEWTLDAGLYVVSETRTPEGVVAAGDFLLALPLTDPVNKDAWLDTVHIYPKNHSVTATKTVANRDKLVVGNTVTWSISVENPSPRDPITGAKVATDRFTVTDVLTDAQLTTAADGSGVKVTAPAGLKRGTDFEVRVVAGTGSDAGKSTVTVDFLAAGLTKVAAAAGNVTLTIDTVVQAPGSIQNIASVYSSSAQQVPTTTPPAIVKYGNLNLVKKSTGAPEGTKAKLQGAEFLVFANENEARAAVKGSDEAKAKALKPAVTVPGYNPTTGVWTTNEEGKVTITGLRYSAYADGTDLADAAQLRYWLVETKALENHQLLAEPVSFVVGDNAQLSTKEITNEYNRNGFVLPLTGGTGTLLLTVSGIALLAIVLVVARRRRAAAAE